MLVVLSRASVESEWCKKELSSGLIRELEEKRVVVIPVLIEECEIPPFLRDKLYADFRRNFDEGLRDLLRALAKHTSDTLGRAVEKGKEYLHDWGISWGTTDSGNVFVEMVAASHSSKFPFSVLTIIRAVGNGAASLRYMHFERHGLDWYARKAIVGTLLQRADEEVFRLLITDNFPVIRRIELRDQKSDLAYRVEISVRRLGEDSGLDVLYDVKEILVGVFQQMEGARRNPAKEEIERILHLLLEKQRRRKHHRKSSA